MTTQQRNSVTCPPDSVATDELRPALQRALAERFGRAVEVAELVRRPSAYRSSFSLEELDLRLADGAQLRLMFKDLGPHSLSPTARDAKPDFLYNPVREINVYRRILASYELGTATYFGSVIEPASKRYWLFLERVAGVELYQVGELNTWQAVASWLARFHAGFESSASRLAAPANLLIYDRAYYQRWIERAWSQLPARRSAPQAIQSIGRLLDNYETVVSRLLALQRTLIHGEMYASNVLIENRQGVLRICPIDWEMAGIGPGLVDLAALVGGAWTGVQRQALIEAYCAALPSDHSGRNFAELTEHTTVSLDYCRLHTAIQWLGWSEIWTPPASQTYDWLGEAIRLADQLELI